MSQSLSNKIALVTGGTSGIGLATAQAFHAAGARVFVTGQNPATLAIARDVLPPEVTILRADARLVADAARVADEIRKQADGLDIVFLNAGVARFAPLDAVDESHYDDIMNVNVKGVVFGLQKVLPLLRPGASVLVNTSVVGHKGMKNTGVYAASKGALSALVRTLAVELAGRGVRVNAISPGPIDTPIFGKMGVPREAQDAMATSVPMQRLGVVDEIARTAVFLASEAASFVTGAELAVDGGIAAA